MLFQNATVKSGGRTKPKRHRNCHSGRKEVHMDFRRILNNLLSEPRVWRGVFGCLTSVAAFAGGAIAIAFVLIFPHTAGAAAQWVFVRDVGRFWRPDRYGSFLWLPGHWGLDDYDGQSSPPTEETAMRLAQKTTPP